MTVLIAGLIVFLGAHSLRIVADGWRNAQVARLGEKRWKGLYTIVSLAGFALIVWGFGLARQSPVVLYTPPVWARHVAALLMLPAFILVVAGNLRGTKMKAAFGHPMVLGTKVWAFGHLLANGTLADMVLFGSFLAWAVADYVSARRRDRVAGVVYPAGAWSRDALAVVVGVAAWFVFGFWLHGWLFGVRPFG
jgi:uncharacterized membrane protein